MRSKSFLLIFGLLAVLGLFSRSAGAEMLETVSAVISAPVCSPRGVQKGVSTPVICSVSLSSAVAVPEQLTLWRLGIGGEQQIGVLRDDGERGDAKAGDLHYTGMAILTEPVEGNVRLQVSGYFENLPREQRSPVGIEVVSCFPSGLKPVDPSRVRVDAVTGRRYLSDEIFVRFDPITACPVISQVVKEMGGTVLGGLPEKYLLQIRIADTGSADGVNRAVAGYQHHQEVISAEPHYVAPPAPSAASPK